MRKLFFLISVVTLTAAACGSGGSKTTTATTSGGRPTGTHTLVGTFKVTPGACTSSTNAPTGSYLELLGNGAVPVKNSFGGCANPAFTPLKPGTDGGLTTGHYQPNPTPAFSGTNALADGIFQPANFFGSQFALATQASDPQTKAAVPPPSIVSDAGQLSGNLAALDVAYNGAYFNQGAPKPNGTYPGTTKALSGTIDCNGDYTASWQSLIVGGAFNNYTGIWHISGTFVPASGTAAAAIGC
ncbi:MAG: hypothetical protein ACYC1D_01325 [Acidimicrobiales bacterium]